MRRSPTAAGKLSRQRGKETWTPSPPSSGWDRDREERREAESHICTARPRRGEQALSARFTLYSEINFLLSLHGESANWSESLAVAQFTQARSPWRVAGSRCSVKSLKRRMENR